MSCCSRPLPAKQGKVAPTTSTTPKATSDAKTSKTPPIATTKKTGTPRSFYRRPLPESCTALSSEEGQERFASAMAHQGTKSFFPLIEQFTTQSEPAFCGISTLVIVLNALAVDPMQSWKGPWRWYEESMLNCGLDLEEVKTTGITLSEFRCLAVCQGLQVILKRADEENDEEIGVANFRQAVKRACVKDPDSKYDKDEFLVVSYSRKILGQTGTGHFSPVAAYDSQSDSVLVLDTARFKYGAHWVSLPLLFQAMMPIDPDTNRSRGYMLLSDHEQNKEDDRLPLMPSLLFRSQRKQNPIRREYKDFLAKMDSMTFISFDEVAAFWVRGGPKYIWNMLEPQFKPIEDEESTKLIASVQDLIQSLLPQVKQQALPKDCCSCRVNYSRTVDLTPEEAIFVVYLASLDEKTRRDIVTMNKDGKKSELSPAHKQLLTEAELVRFAIDMSDKEHAGECK